MTRPPALLLSLLLPIIPACTDEASDKADDTGSETGDSSGALDLDNCTTDIADGVPAFFSTFFRCVTITSDGDTVTVTSDGLPPHTSPYYDASDPNYVAFDDRGGQWRQNPNSIAAQDYEISIASTPVSRGLTIDADLVDRMAGTSSSEYGGPGAVPGLALDGVALFHGVAAPGDDIAEEQYSFDLWEGHPQDSGQYHHHSATPASLAVLEHLGFTSNHEVGSGEIELYGIMCDGVPVLGCTELDGSTPDDSDMDAQNGHVHDLVGEDGTLYFSGRYHTHLCAGVYDDEFAPEIQYYDGCD